MWQGGQGRLSGRKAVPCRHVRFACTGSGNNCICDDASTKTVTLRKKDSSPRTYACHIIRLLRLRPSHSFLSADFMTDCATGLGHRLACEYVLLRAQGLRILLLHIPIVWGSATLWLNMAEFNHRKAFPNGGFRLADVGFDMLPELPSSWSFVAEQFMVSNAANQISAFPRRLS